MPIGPLPPLLLAAALGAVAPSDDPVLAGLVAEALANNPDLRAANAAALAARQRPAQAGALADPVLGVGYTSEGWVPTLGALPQASLAVTLSQDLPFPGKRRMRGQLASLDADLLAQQVERARLAVVAAVRRAYASLLQSRALLELTRDQSVLWQQIEGVARARYSVGQGNQQEVLRTQVELTRVGQDLAEQQAEESIRVAEINRILGRPAETALDGSPALGETGAAEPLAAEMERLRAASPELAAARVAADRARLALDLARKEYRPDFNVQAAYINRGGLDPMWQAGVSLNLPLNRKRRAAGVSEAEAALAEARARLETTELQLRLRTQERLARLDAARTTGTLYREGIVPQDRMSVEAALASYQAGRVPFITVFESLTTLYGDRVRLIRLLAGQARTRASLDEASLEPTTDATLNEGKP